MNRIREHLSYSNLVSTLCLFLLLGGGAYAAIKIPRASVGTKQLKANAVKGPKVAPGSLSASDISGSVNAARAADEADHADDSDRLGGQPPASFISSDRVTTFKLDVSSSGSQFDLLAIGPLDMDASCTNFLDTQFVGFHATSSGAGAGLGWGLSSRDISDPAPTADANFTNLSGTESNLLSPQASNNEVGAGQFLYDDVNTTIAITFRYRINETNDDCVISGVATQS